MTRFDSALESSLAVNREAVRSTGFERRWLTAAGFERRWLTARFGQTMGPVA